MGVSNFCQGVYLCRVGSFGVRPAKNKFEIPYLGRSGANIDRQIPIDDLRVSIRGDRIVLRSSRLGKEVLPRLTSAQNHGHRTLGIYRFLCSLQYQGVCNPAWDWGG